MGRRARARAGDAPPGAAYRARSQLGPGAALVAARALLRVALGLPAALLVLAVRAVRGLERRRPRRVARRAAPRARVARAGRAALALAPPLTLAGSALASARWATCPEGRVARGSAAWLRLLLALELTERAGTWLSGSLFWPPWLRLAGMRVGRGSEVSTVVDLVPSQAELGARCFLADGVYLGGPRLEPGGAVLAPGALGDDAFLGNHAVVPAGTRLPGDVLVGVSTVADGAAMRGGGAWFGQPPLALARPPVRALDRRLTHEPDLLRRVTRVTWELARFALPLPRAALAVLWLDLAARLGGGVLALGSATVATGAAAVAGIVALKWLLLGRVRPGRHALWSCWCSRWDFLYVAWGQLARGALAQLEGTLLLAPVLRAFGVRVGKRVLLGAGFAQVVDPDMLELADDATVAGLFQAHTFEERVLKIDRVRVGRRATVGAGAVLFYGVDVGEGARVAPHAVASKGERVPPGAAFDGVPARPA
ncbi:MAG: hypothetical protein H6828_08235 [Planctomycetes bacterium]|nr:hypothetical protein [Planctomycetota bacterium]